MIQKYNQEVSLFFSSRISKSDVLKTLANNDKKESDTRQTKDDKNVMPKKEKQLPKVCTILEFGKFPRKIEMGKCIPHII